MKISVYSTDQVADQVNANKNTSVTGNPGDPDLAGSNSVNEFKRLATLTDCK